MARVIVYVMDNEDRDTASQAVGDLEERNDSFVLGEADPDTIDDLRNQGLLVQVLDEEEPAEAAAPGPGVDVFAAKRVWVEREIEDMPRGDAPNVYLIQLKGPLLDRWRAALGEIGVKLLEAAPPFGFTARMVPGLIHRVGDLPFVNRIRLYDSKDTLKARDEAVGRPPRFAAPPTEPVERKMLTFDVRLHPAANADKIRTWLEDRNVAIGGATSGKFRIYTLEGSSVVNELALLPEVAIIEEYMPPELHNDVARVLLGIDPPQGPNPAPGLQFSGQGEIIGVADTGLDETHPDFQGRVIGTSIRGGPGITGDTHGHGKHVAGSVLGDGNASGGQLRGAAPGAELYFQSLLDPSGGLGGLPLDLNDLFYEAYQNGVRIHNNSWGSATGSRYTVNSIEVDEFVASHRDMLIVISAGNEGTAAEPRHSPIGFVDWLSIGSPASSKNSLTVGASRSDRAGVGLSGLTYGNAWPADFPDGPIADQYISGNPQALAGFSSRGPCDDHRIKPDLVAPGTDIASAKSSRAPLRNFWGPYPGNARYAFMGGTSMSAPLVTGCAALVRQYYRTERNHPNPSAALLKATLINSTRWLTADDALAEYNTNPNFHQGFGCLYMPWAVPNESEPTMALNYVDNWQDHNEHLAYTGEQRKFQFHVTAGTPLRICLAWTDHPGRALQHDLNLFLRHLDTNARWAGNADLPLKITAADSENNVEIIRLDQPMDGEYVIQVSAFNLLHGPQDFALVVTGNIGQLTRI